MIKNFDIFLSLVKKSRSFLISFFLLASLAAYSQPVVTIGAPSTALTQGGPVTFTITYLGATTINLTAADINLTKSPTVGPVTINVIDGTTNTPDVVLSAISGDGTIAINIDPATSNDGTDDDVGAGPSTPFTVDNTKPAISIGAPSTSLTTSGPVTFAITYSGANTVTLTAADISLEPSGLGTAAGTISVANGNTNTPTVTISSITGDGNIAINIASGTASDNAGNIADSQGPSTAFEVDNMAPSVPGPPNLATGSDTGASSSDNLTMDNTPTFNGSFGENNVTIKLYDGATQVGSDVVSGGNFSITATTLSDGVHNNLEYTATDPAGNVSSNSTSFSMNIDRAPPTVQLNDNHPDAIVRNADNVTITATFIELNNLDGTPTISIGSTVNNANMSPTGDALIWTYNWNVPSGNNGSAPVSINVDDMAGNTNSAATAGSGPTSYTIDNNPPTFVSVNDTGDNTYRSGETITFDVDLGETGLTVTANLTVINAGFSASQALNDDGDGTYSYTTPNINTGGNMLEGASISVTFSATDVAGNNNTDNSLTLLLDKTSPSFSSGVIANSGKNKIVVTFNEDITLSNANGFSVAGTSAGPITTVTGSGSNILTFTLTGNAFSTDALTLSYNNVTGNAKDGVGNNLNNFSNSVITNNVVPAIISAQVVNANPDKLIATFDEPISLLNTAGFSVSDTEGNIIGSVTGNGTVTLTFTLNKNVRDTDNILFHYNGSNGGTTLAAFSNLIVNNLVQAIPEPQDHVSAFSAVAASTSTIDLTWTESGNAQLPENYLIVGIDALLGSFPGVTDGSPVADDADWSDFDFAMNVAAGTSNLTISNLVSGRNYIFRIYPYTNVLTSIDYKTSAVVPEANASPNVGAQTIISGGAGVATLTSIIDTKSEALAAADNFTFNIQDDGASPTADSAPTYIDGMVINRDIANDQTGDWTNLIAGVVLKDNGSGTLNSGDNPASFVITADAITITGIPNSNTSDLGYVADNATKTYSVVVWLKTDIVSSGLEIDNKKMAFTVADTDILVETISEPLSSILATSAASSGASNNVIEVTATEVFWKSVTGVSTAHTNFIIVVQATDENKNRDYDETSHVDMDDTTAPTDGYLESDGFPNDTDENFVMGQFIRTDMQVHKLGTYYFEAVASGLTTGTTGPHIFIAGDAQSDILASSFDPPDNIDYKLFQEALIDGNGIGDIKIAEFEVQDGGTITGNDSDGAPTVLTDITLSLSNYGNIRQIAIHDGTGIVESKVAAASVTFANLTTISADDDGTALFSIYVSFKSTVTDNENLQVQITDAIGSGSTFAVPNAGNAGSPLVGDDNRIEVIASQLDFNPTPLNAIQGVNIPVLPTEPQVFANDINGNLDLDFNAPALVTSAVGMANIPIVFSNITPGVLDFPGFIYTGSGVGTISVTAGGINGLSNNIDVLHVAAVTADTGAPPNTDDIGNNGISTEDPIFGGSPDRVLFGATFSSAYSIPSQPKLQEITVDFGNPISGVLDNIRVYISSNNIFEFTDPLISATIDIQSDYINISGINHDFFTSGNATIFIKADINVNVSSSTLPITPSLIKTTQGSTNIIVSANASSFSNITARTYNFRDFFDPFLTNQSPLDGDENFGLGQDIVLTFNENVTTIDRKISVFTLDGSSKIDIRLRNLDSSTGSIFSFPTNEVDPLTGIDLPGPVNRLASDTWYYISVRQGTDSTGFRDLSDNPFDSIPPLGWRFKTADTTPPVLLASMPSSMDNVTVLGGDLKVALNEKGTIFYMVIATTDTDPTSAEVFDPSLYTGEILSGSIDILQDSTYHFAPIFSNLFTNGTTYEIHYIAVDNGGNKMANTSLITFVTSNPSGTGLILDPLDQAVCQGNFQTLFPPISITERSNNDFTNANNQTINLALPLGYTFNTSAPNDVVTFQQGGNVTTAELRYINNTILELKFSTNGTNKRDRLTISGLEIGATGVVPSSGNIIRSGGNALLSELVDGTVLGNLNTFAIPEVKFITNPNSNIIGNNIAEVLLTPLVSLEDNGVNVFTGEGVIGNKLITSTTTLGTHIITMTHTTEEGCVSISNKTIELFDNDNAIAGLKTSYCTDEGGDFVLFNGKFPTYDLLSLSVNFANDTLAAGILGQIGDLTTLQSSLIDTTTIDYFFDPSVLALPDSITNFTNEGGLLGDIIFTAAYKNKFTLETDTFRQQVKIFIPPTTTLTLDSNLPSALLEYCEDYGTIQLSGLPVPSDGISTGFFTISLPDASVTDAIAANFIGLTDNGDGNATLNTQEVVDNLLKFGKLEINYIYQRLGSGCSSTSSQIIRINPTPVANFTVPQVICEDTEINFTDITGYDQADLNIISSADTVLNAIAPPIAQWSWNFNDSINSPGSNIATDSSTTHNYAEPDLYDVKLSVWTDKGCTANVTNQLVIGGLPNVNFNFVGTSVNEDLAFTSTSGVFSNLALVHTVDSLIWDFGDGTVIADDDNDNSQNNEKTFLHSYASNGLYNVELHAFSTVGCYDSLTRTVAVLKNIIAGSTANSGDRENFNTDNGDWITVPELDINGNPLSTQTWEWGVPDKAVIKAQDGGAWVTSLTNKYDSAEQSFVYSPAYDLRNLERPMIQLEIFKDLEEQDGVILEYSTDNFNIMDSRKSWIALGAIDQGIEWFDVLGLAGSPGNDATGLGWTGTSADTSWVTAKHSLGDIYQGNFTAAEIDSIKSKVVFRIGLGAIASANTKKSRDGFAFDDVFIGNRTRTVLIENFTSMAKGGDTKSQNESINTLANSSAGSTELVVISYHTSFEGSDALNLQNPSEPATRALYYGISSSPQVSIDGESPLTIDNSVTTFDAELTKRFSVRTLQIAPFDIKLELDKNNINDDKVRIFASIIAQEKIDTSFVVHIAVVEKVTNASDLDISGEPISGESVFYNTLKKMLPSAAGTRYIGGMAQTDSISISESWNPTNIVNLTPSDLRIVVFIQNEVTKEVLQAAWIDYSSDIVLAIEKDLVNNGIALYPNPANRYINIKLASKMSDMAQAIIFDNTGRKIEEVSIPVGHDLIELNTLEYRPGIYIFTLPTDSGTIMKRFIIQRR
jgi:Bacterial Ig-like domain/Secretion system C-terminal sorting domain